VPPVVFGESAKPRSMWRRGWLDGLKMDAFRQWVVYEGSARGIDHLRLGQNPDLMATSRRQHGSKTHFRLRALIRCACICRKQHLHHWHLPELGSLAVR
jgi:hypothetical protein